MRIKYTVPETCQGYFTVQRCILSNIENLETREYGDEDGEDPDSFWDY